MNEKNSIVTDKNGRRYLLIKGEKLASCYPCTWEGSIYPCPNYLCNSKTYLRDIKIK